ncbi:MAG: RecX family transcriptional regulator [Prevotellaceae bacterium]|jgi:regulatory protein|nr:RecX family transcriptional regulator [Prevotellaceae bacterium]
MKKALTEPEALQKAAAYCSVAERCRYEVAVKLKAWEMSEAASLRILNRLEQERYLDEARYCRAFVRDKWRFAKWGKVKIAQALAHKQLPPDAVADAIAEIDDREYTSLLKNLLSAKAKSIRSENDYERKGKLIRFALSRGFEMKDILRVLAIFIPFPYFCGLII